MLYIVYPLFWFWSATSNKMEALLKQYKHYEKSSVWSNVLQSSFLQ